MDIVELTKESIDNNENDKYNENVKVINNVIKKKY